MNFLVLESLFWLSYFEAAMYRKKFQMVHGTIRRQPVRATSDRSKFELNRAIDLACALYLHQVLCLQRSAATTILLRRHGIPADMVVGVRLLPFRSHAWVEVAGEVFNDKSYVNTMYSVLERC